MKLLIALTPGILIGCALVETCASILTGKQSAPAAPVVRTTHPPVHVPIFNLNENSSPATGTLAVARLQAPRGGH